MHLRTLSLALSGLFLSLGLACGGGSSSPAPTPAPAAAAGLAYTDPSGSGWRLVKDASSTPTKLVLNLVGPAGTLTRGVGLHLQAPAGVKFGTFADGLGIHDTGVYDLLSEANDVAEPVALVAGVKAGNVLTAGIFQKARAKAAKDSGVALCQFILGFDTTAGLKVGDALPLLVQKAKVIPQDIGLTTDDLRVLDQKMRMADITVAVGTLTAR
ncbi:MAG: hypothetical protein IPI84_13560 [Holophagaceae bacterium]|nr:hypothetical protein [Holophagaceae bacterium]